MNAPPVRFYIKPSGIFPFRNNKALQQQRLA